MAMRATVDLIGHAGTGVILKCPSGVEFVNQSGGTYCLQPSCEGIFVPWFNDVEIDPPVLIGMQGALQAWSGGVGVASGRLSASEADALDAILGQTPSYRGI